jgi:hypothetical protein
MAGKLQLIEQRLIALDTAGSQNLCDAYIILHEKDYKSFNRAGSQFSLGTLFYFSIRLSDNGFDFNYLLYLYK